MFNTMGKTSWCWRRSLTILLLAIIKCSVTDRVIRNDLDKQSIPNDFRRSINEALAMERAYLAGDKINTNCSVERVRTIAPCPPSKYRSASCECNNVRKRHWGTPGDIMMRLLPARYADGVSRPYEPPAVPDSSEVIRGLAQLSTLEPHDYVVSLLAAWGHMLIDDLVTTTNEKEQEYCTADVCQYTRAGPSRDIDTCEFKQREIMNMATGFLDLSALYGNSEKHLGSLRLYDLGKLDVTSCRRCKGNSPTAALYKMLITEHNVIAAKLYEINSFWDDTKLFLETRRLLVALVQHITYNEFLPVLLGEVGMTKSDLSVLSRGFWNGYSSSNRAGVFSELAALAPIFDSLMNEQLINTSQPVTLAQLSSTPAQGPRVSPNWSWHVNRARDAGVGSYLAAARLCDPMRLNSLSLDDLPLHQSHRELLDRYYKDKSSIDLLVGGALEKPAKGAVFGATLACLFAFQFGNLRKSDRFWYENDLPPSSFSADQLASIRQVTLSGLICSANDDIEQIQPRAFVAEDQYLNAAQFCAQHPSLDLTPWKVEDIDAGLSLADDTVKTALKKAQSEMMARKRMEYVLWEMNGGADPKSPVGIASAFSKANKYALRLANSSLLFEFATNEILNSLKQNNRRKRQVFDSTNNLGFSPINEFADALHAVDVATLFPGPFGPEIEPECDENGPCDLNSPFRTITGYCNNLRNPNLGKSLTTFSRLLPPVYEDGVSRPRINSVTGTQLPSPRVVSTVIHPDISNLHNRYTLMVMQFAQLLDHELTMTPIHKGFQESLPDCRSCDSPRTVHPECNPFPVPRGDHYYPEFNVTSGERLCFPFMRSLPGQQTLGPREQVNQNTAFLDGSAIYGENPCIARKLRGFNGRMNATTHPVRGLDLLPRTDSHPECRNKYCFLAGDGRASEQPGLTALHTILMREHNRVVEGLRGVNPHWDGEILYQQSRKIVTAEFNHIVYNEFLPRLLSWNAVNLYGLKLLNEGYYKEYSPTCNPAIVTEFAAAAFRIGHSLLRPHLPRMSHNYQPVDPPILLRDGFFKSDMFLQPSMVEELARGLVSTPMETLDQFITGEVTNHLFEDRKIPFSGIDLIALNVQRARDHGISSYNNYRALCNLKRAATFEDLSREIPDEVIARLKRIYPTVDDIDLFPGGMSERPLQGGLVGPTFACIIAIQFRQLRKCDRFWYENEDPVVRFTEPQLAEIRKTTLSKVMCDNFDQQSDIQRAAFDLPSNFLNPRVPCSTLPQVDLTAWRESAAVGCSIAGRNVPVGGSAFPSPCTSCICTTEGAQCASLRITNCVQLLREWPSEAVLRDDVCAAQCGADAQRLTQRTASSNFNPDLVPPPPRQPRRNILPNIPHLPDLSAFLRK